MKETMKNFLGRGKWPHHPASIGTTLFLFLFLASAVARAQTGFVHTRGKMLVDGAGRPLLLRGTSFGNWLVPEGYMLKLEDGVRSPHGIEELTENLLGPEQSAAFWKSYRRNYITRDDVEFVKRAGFNSIRIPFHYQFFANGNNEGFALLDPVVAWAHEEGLYVILDMHCTPGGQNGANIDDSNGHPWLFASPSSQKEAIAIWTRIARHYSSNHTILGYDLINEPLPGGPLLNSYRSQLEPLYKRIVAAVRTVDRNHVVILGGGNWDMEFSVFGAPFDRNVMYTFHRYKAPPTTATIQPYLDFRDKYNVPIWLGESGENVDSWIATFRELMEKNNISWAFWPYKKMDSTSSPVTFAQPPHWDEIKNFAAHASVTHPQAQAQLRPSDADIHAAFDGLLFNIQFKQNTVNPGYLAALGLTVPQ